jgi:thiol-disulfide isomerase/thioredoxin
MKQFAGSRSNSEQSRKRHNIPTTASGILLLLILGCSTNGPTPIPAAVTSFGSPLGMVRSVLVQWSAPEAISGAEPVSFDMRYATSAMSTSGDWAKATVVTDLPAPASPGTFQHIVITGLDPGVDYYFAMRVRGRNGELSQFSSQIGARPIDTLTLGTYQVRDLSDSVHSTTEWLGHRLALLNFWGVWCHWCVVEMPDLKELYGAYADSDVVLVGLDYGDSQDRVQTFVTDNAIPWENYFSVHELQMDYNIGGYPTTAFLDADGHLLGTHVGSASFDEYQRLVSFLLAQTSSASQTASRRGQT